MSDMFGDSKLFHAYFGSITTNAVRTIGVESQTIELLEIGVSVGAFSGGSTPNVYTSLLEVANVNAAGFFSVSKGASLYDGEPLTNRLYDDNTSFVKRFKRQEQVHHLSPYLLNPAGYRFAIPDEYTRQSMWGLQLRVVVSGAPTSITHVTAWARYRELEEPSSAG
jgi:hypothetical protein